MQSVLCMLYAFLRLHLWDLTKLAQVNVGIAGSGCSLFKTVFTFQLAPPNCHHSIACSKQPHYTGTWLNMAGLTLEGEGRIGIRHACGTDRVEEGGLPFEI